MDLGLGAIDMTNVNKREREKEKERDRERGKKTIKKAPNSSNITSILKREYVCMGNA